MLALPQLILPHLPGALLDTAAIDRLTDEWDPQGTTAEVIVRCGSGGVSGQDRRGRRARDGGGVGRPPGQAGAHAGWVHEHAPREQRRHAQPAERKLRSAATKASGRSRCGR